MGVGVGEGDGGERNKGVQGVLGESYKIETMLLVLSLFSVGH